MTNESNIKLAKRIRNFEYQILKQFKAGKIPGTIHCCIGQELDTVDIISQLLPGDSITSNHRGHGHFLAYTKDFIGLYDELRAMQSGVNGGKSLSQHLHKDNFYATGIQGGFVPVACGMAMAEKLNNSSNIVVCFIGDGTLGQGVLYESLNLAALWKLPIYFVLENNQYAMSTPISQSIAGSIAGRFKAFGLNHVTDNFREKLPAFRIIDTYRFCGHSGNDSKTYRTTDEELEWIAKDKLGGYLCQNIMSLK